MSGKTQKELQRVNDPRRTKRRWFSPEKRVKCILAQPKVSVAWGSADAEVEMSKGLWKESGSAPLKRQVRGGIQIIT